jgi:DNA-directed RNA polymerase specialized sigma24 family protein
MPSERPFTELMSKLAQGDRRPAEVVWERFARRLTALAANRLPGLLRAKTDPESVVLSVFRSFFARHQDAPFAPGSWDRLWTLPTVLTVRKCGHRVRYFRAARRDACREQALVEGEAAAGARRADPRPTPEEALPLAETLDELLQGLRPADRPVVEFRLQGHIVEEISRLVGCTGRTVHCVLAKVRARLEGDAAEAGETR